ncbi:type I restriction endonuclease [Synechococcus sp. UW140]|uniref:type I restriction endonuclease n=1 Tax=Synechococcus sp. UW140 TaxID=368503 RepID=UPI0031381C0F
MGGKIEKHSSHNWEKTMDLLDQLHVLAKRAKQSADHLTNEEATKMTLIAPFIQLLGYDIFNPAEVMPEYSADFPDIKSGERVDYAIVEKGIPKILVEAKPFKTNLKDTEKGQLARYFHVTEARVAILTNGRIYQFYTDLDNSNTMDRDPFAEVDLFDLANAPIKELKKLTKPVFDLVGLLESAERLKYLGRVKEEIKKEFNDPSEWLVKEMAGRVHSGKRVTTVIQDQFKPIVEEAIQSIINDRINDRLKSAIEAEEKSKNDEDNTISDEASGIENDGIVTTDDEIEGLYIVKSICAKVVDASRITAKDTKTYYVINLDGKTQKTILRLYFNSGTKKIQIYDDAEPKTVEIETTSDIYKSSERIIDALNKRIAS